MSALGKLVVSLSLEHAAYTKGLDKAGRDAKAFEKGALSSFTNFERSVVSSAKNVAGSLVGVGAAFLSASTAVNSLREAFQFADQINDVSKANEVAVNSVLRLSEALTLNGGKSEDASRVFSALTNKIDEAAGGSESAQKQFAKLGITLNDLATLDGQELFDKTLSGLSAITDPIQRNATAFDLLGKAVKGVDINGLADDYASRQGDFSDAEKSFKEIGQAMDKLDSFTLKASTSLAENFGPVLNRIVTALDDAVFGFDKLEQKIRAQRNQGATEFKAVPLITDKPAAGMFNLPPEYQNNTKRTVIDPAAEAAKKEAERLAKSRIELAKQEAKERAEIEKKFAQENDDNIRKQEEAKYKREIDLFNENEKAKEEAEKDAYEQKLKNIDLLFEANQRRIEEERRLEEEAARAREEANREFSRSLTDALFRGFENGKSFFKNFKDTLINAFQTMILRPRIEAIISRTGLGAVFSGNAYAGTGSGGNIFGDIKSAIDSMNGNLVGSIQDLGTFLSTGNGGLGDTIGGFLGQYSGEIASALPYAGSVMKLLQGDIKGAAFSGAGVAIGSAFGGPVGGAIGGAIGNFVGGLFGGSKLPPRVTQERLASFRDGKLTASEGRAPGRRTLGAATQLDSINSAFATNLKSIFDIFGMETNIDSGAVLTRKKNTSAYFNASVNGQALDGFSQRGKKLDLNKAMQDMFDFALGSMTVQAIQKSGVPEAIKKLFKGVVDKDVVSSLIGTTSKLNSSQKQLAERFGLTLDNSVDMAKQIGLTNAGLSTYLNQLGDAAYAYKSESEIVADAKAALVKSFGGDLPASIDAFDAQIKAVDKTTTEGLKRTSDLLDMRAGFIAYQEALKQLNNTLVDSANTLVDSATALNLIDSNNFTDRASFEAAKAFAGQGLRGIYNSSNADLNGKLMVGELQKLREGIAELIKQAQATSASTLETARVLLNVTDGASLITTAG